MKAEACGHNVAMGLLVVGVLASSALAGYDVSDLSGTWSVHGVVFGDDPNVPGSFYMTGTADAAGSATATNYVDSEGVGEATWADNAATFDLSGGGILSLESDDIPFYGAMTWGKDLVVSVNSGRPGPDTGLAGNNLWMWVKQSPTPVFSLADGAGTWWLHSLNAGRPGSAWARGKLEIDGSGNFSFVEGTWVHSEGPTVTTPEDGTVTITNAGVLGFSFDPMAHGIMSVGKDLIVASMTDNTGGSLNVFQKRSGATFSTADLVGTWHFHNLVLELSQDSSVWAYGMLEVGAGGALQGYAVNSGGHSETYADTFSITSDGVVSRAGDPYTHGMMSDDKDLIVLTGDDGQESCTFVVLVRAIVSPVYRFWSPQNSRHFYTVSTVEKNYVQTTFASNIWTYETEAYYAFPQSGQTGLAPVYRFWSNSLSAHFYTINEAERDYVIDNLAAWAYEGPVFYAYPEGSQPVDASPVYRFWSESLSTHFYTISEAEKDYVIDNLPSWAYETVAWYAYE